MPSTSKRQPIRWVRYHVRNVHFGQQLKMLDLPSPAAAPAAAGGMKTVAIDLPNPDDAVGVPAGEELVFELPDRDTLPPIATLAVALLEAAAEVEHGLLVQYLYAGYSQKLYKLAGARDVITGIAIEEMSHLMTVQNLLMLLGRPPHMYRQDFALPADAVERLFPFPLMLEPLSKVSLAKYVLAEAPESADQQAPVVMAAVRAAVGHGQTINRVGMLYALLGVAFGTKQLLMERAAEGDEWYQMVHRLAAILNVIYGSRDKIHLADDQFPDPNPNVARQGTDEEWDRSRVGSIDEFRVFPRSAQEPLFKRRDALAALRDISIQGEGSSVAAGANAERSHFRRFLDQFQQLFGADGAGTNPVAAYPVPAGAVIPVGQAGPDAINHPESVKWATLGDLRYALLLGFLQEYLIAPPADRTYLASWVFAEMYNLKWLGDFLVKSPRREGTPPSVAAAALPFTMPADGLEDHASAEGKWPKIHATRLQEAIGLADQLLPTLGANTDSWIFLNHLLVGDRRKLAEAEARQKGKSVRTRFHKVSEILDLAAGAGHPSHKGKSPLTGTGSVSQRRFWNLPLDHFKQTAIYGTSLIEPVAGPGSDPGLVDILINGGMPLDRPQLAATGPEITHIAQWIKDGCPDAPLPAPAGGQNPPAANS